METQQVHYYELEGSYEEIGKQIAKYTDQKEVSMPAPDFFSNQDMEDALQLYERYCPGICEELEGFAKEAGIDKKDIAYTWMTYLIPRCSGLIVLGNQMEDGHTRLARNYEFNIGDEDLSVCRTSPKGKYAHIGGSIAIFGRCEGINEYGLCVSMSSCGLPVGNIVGMRKAEIKGLQFWAVIRSLLENCKNVEEAIAMALEMPIAYNINLYLADAACNGVLLETMNGNVAYEQISSIDSKQYLCGTNHIVLSSFQSLEPAAMRNSVVRYEKIVQFANEHEKFKEQEIREFLLKQYPEGMTAYYYDEWFGTIKSVVMDAVERRFSICWFGQEANGWEDYIVTQSIENQTLEKQVVRESASPDFFEWISLNI
ncbi:MAG: C45 family autoproteolytic acyltransferase/hydrolase [Velocimicrobium sp.]